MIKRLKELFIEIHQKPMEEQRTILHRTFFDWISYDQGSGSEKLQDCCSHDLTGIRVCTPAELLQIEPVCIHDFHPCFHEVVYKLLLIVVLRIELCIGTQYGI